MKITFTPPIVLLVLGIVFFGPLSACAMENAEPDSGGAVHQPSILRFHFPYGSAGIPSMVAGITDLGRVSDSTDNVWALTMGPNGSSVVYGGTTKGTAHGGKLFKYDPNSPGMQLRIIDEVSGEYGIMSLVAADDSIYGGTRDNGHFFSFDPAARRIVINDFGTILTGDSSVTALIMGCGVKDPDWVYGATSQKDYYIGGYGAANGGRVFVFKPESTLVRDLGRPASSQRNIHAMTNFIRPGPIGWICPGTGPDSTYVGVRCGGDCDQAVWDTVTEWPHSGDAPWVSGLCRTSDDSVFGTTCDVGANDSAVVFLFIWGDTPQMTLMGYLRTGERRAGPMTTGDGKIYFCSVHGSGANEEPRFYRWTNRGLWNPGQPGSGVDPEYWSYVDQNSDISRYRALAYAGNGEVYIGTGGANPGEKARLLKFHPTALLQRSSSNDEPDRSGVNRGEVLLAVYPNPCRGEAQVAYSIPGQACPLIDLTIHDMAGRKVRKLIQGNGTVSSGIGLWDGLDDSGRRVPAGIYFCTMTASGLSRTQKLTFLR